MPLQKALVPVDIVAGLDTKTDEKLTAKLTDLQNGRYNIGSQISKRLGYDSLSQEIAGSATTLSAGDGLASFQNELLEFSGSKLYSYSSGISKWVDRGSYLSLKTQATDIVRNTSEARNQDSCIASGLILYAWESYDSAGSLEGVYATVLDQVSGTVLQAETLIDSTAVNPRCIPLGNNPTLVYVDTSSSPNIIKTVQVDTDSPDSFKSAKTVVSDVKAATPHLDVAVFSTSSTNGSGVCAYVNNTSNTISVTYLTLDGSPGQPANGYPSSVNFSSSNAEDGIAITCDVYNTDNATQERIYVGYWANSGSEGLTLKRFSNLFNLEDTETIQATSTLIDSCSLFVDSSSLDLNILYTLTATNEYDYLIRKAVYDPATSAITSAAADLKRSVGLAGKMFEYEDIVYFIGVHDSDLQPTYFVFDFTGLIVAKLLPGVAGGLPSTSMIASVANTSAGLFEFGGLVRTRLISKNNDLYSLAGISRMELDYTSVERFESAELGENLHVGGGFISMYDSQEIVEMNYHLYPENISASVNNSSGSLAAGTYQYKCIYYWTDARGQVHRSAPSVALSASPTGGSSTVTLTIPTLRLTSKTNVLVEVYRTVTLGSLFYKIGRVANNTAADSVSFADSSMTDANLIAKETLYTDGGILANTAPPASLVIAPYKNRLIAVASENPKKLIYSKSRAPKGAVEFTDTFQITLNKAQRVTALAEFDQKLMIFEPDQIFYITGNGPNSTGAQDDFSPPQIVTGDVGCQNTNSLVLMPLGLMFQSKKGIYLLDRSLKTQYIGADVEAYNGLTITSAELIENENQIRYLTSDGRALIYDYYFGKWATWTNHEGQGATIWNVNGNYVYLRSDGRIFEQSSTSYKDGDDPIEMSLTTSWVKTNQVQGFQRVRAAYVLGDFKSDHTLKLEIATDYQNYFNETHRFDYISDLSVDEYGDSSPYGDEDFYGTGSGVSDGVYQFRAKMGKQKCESMRFRISDMEEINPGQAYSISSLMLEVGMKPTGMKLPKQKLV